MRSGAWCLLLILLFAPGAMGHWLDEKQEDLWLLPGSSWLLAADQQTSAAEVAERFQQGAGRVFSNRTANLGLVQQPVWLQFQVAASPEAAQRLWQLYLDWPNFNQVTLYRFQKGEWLPQVRQQQYTFAGPALYTSPRPLFTIWLTADQPEILLLRIDSEEPVLLAPRLLSARALLASERQLFAWVGVYFGIIVALALYNLFLWIGLRDFSYLWYSLFISVTALFFGLNQGFLLDFWPQLSHRALLTLISLTISGMILSALLFSRSFLLLPERDLWMNRLNSSAIVLAAVLPLVTLLASEQLAIYFNSASGLVIIACILLAGVRGVLSGFHSARVLLLAWLALVVGFLLHLGVYLGLLPYSFPLLSAFQVGSALQAIILSMALAYRIRLLQREQEKLKREGEQLTQLSITDGLTGLYNRRYWQSSLQQLVTESHAAGEALSAVLLDVDHFKRWNDQWGHQAGDEVLIRLSEVLRLHTGQGQLAGRFGGEEFVVLLPGFTLQQAADWSERLCRAVAEIEVYPQKGVRQSVTASFGVAQLLAEESAQHLLQRCDQALYRAKAAGRNRVITAV